MKSKVSGVKGLPPPGSGYANYDFITSPLPHDPLDGMDELGEESRGDNVHEDVLVVAACTWKGEEHISSSERDIVVPNMGVGQIGSGSSVTEFGIAGMSQRYLDIMKEVDSLENVQVD